MKDQLRMPPNKRLEMLEQMAAAPDVDAFTLYGLAMEYRRAARTEESLKTFERLRELHSDYLAMYLMAGQLLLENEQKSAAAVWLGQGIELATKNNNAQTLGELEAALEDAHA